MKILDVIDLTQQPLNGIVELLNTGKKAEAYEEFKDYFLKRENYTPHFILTKDVREYLADKHQEEIEEIIKVADQVCEQNFIFRFPWDMEKTSVPVKFEGEINWKNIEKNDPEWCWMINRHRYWISLGQAYFLTGDEKYANTFFKQVNHWIKNNPIYEIAEPSAWRRIEAGIRCENWIRAFEFFKDSISLDIDTLDNFLYSLYEHGEYIMEIFSGFEQSSNWGILQNHGLFDLSVFLHEAKRSKEWQKNSLERLKETARIQIYSDGIHWENSSMYHHEVLHSFLDNITLAEKNNISYPKGIKETAHRMSKASMNMMRPDRNQPLNGDSDDTCISDIMTTAACLFEDNTLKISAYDEMDLENIMMFGIEAGKRYREMKPKEPGYTSIALEATGNYLMRDNWNRDSNYLRFFSGMIGGNHGHADALHIDLVYKGKGILWDLGRYNYSDTTEYRKYFKMAPAHNTTMVDDIDTCEYVHSWAYDTFPRPLNRRWLSTEAFDYVQGSHDGYMKLSDPVLPTRKIVYIKGEYWIIFDIFAAKESHNYKQFFNFDSVDVELKDNRVNSGGMNILPLMKMGTTLKKRNIKISKEYNLIEDSIGVVVERNGQGVTTMPVVIYPKKGEQRTVVSVEEVDVFDRKGHVNLEEKGIAEGIRIKFDNGDEDIFCFSYGWMRPQGEGYLSETQEQYLIDGRVVKGEVTVIRKSAGMEDKFIEIC